jgi:hypothetical protein
VRESPPPYGVTTGEHIPVRPFRNGVATGP